MPGRVQDRVVVVTGGASGLGLGLCRAVAAEGAKVVVADLNGEGAARAAQEIAGDGGAAISVDVDVTDRERVNAMSQRAVDEFGELNVIFNNAGMNRSEGAPRRRPRELRDESSASTCSFASRRRRRR